MYRKNGDKVSHILNHKARQIERSSELQNSGGFTPGKEPLVEEHRC
jgi:hypothetical protein